jgi:hypothetical protein
MASANVPPQGNKLAAATMIKCKWVKKIAA